MSGGSWASRRSVSEVTFVRSGSAGTAEGAIFYTPAGPEAFFLENGQEEGSAIPLTREFYDSMVDRMGAHNIMVLPSDHDWA